MYEFRNINKIVSDERIMPSEALKINGEYIENLIPGYQTLSTTGREALSPELDFYDTGVRNGSIFKSKKYPARIITVRYKLQSKTSEEFRHAYNQLGRILDIEDAQLIFNDEKDKFYIGTPSMLGTVDPGKNAVVGEFEITCADPFKYSLMEYVATTAEDGTSMVVNYNGTYKAYPILEADFYKETEKGSNTLSGKGDCGYIAFFTENEKIVQFGDPDEADGTNIHQKSQTLINQEFKEHGAWNDTVKALWEENRGNVLPAIQQIGTCGMGAASHHIAGPNVRYTTILDRRISSTGFPNAYYTIAAKAIRTGANTAHISMAIISSLLQETAEYRQGFSLHGTVTANGVTRTLELKNTDDYWLAPTGISVNFGFTVGGLTESTAFIDNIRFKVERRGDSGIAGILHEVVCNPLPVSKDAESVADSSFLTAQSYGMASSVWHGPSITRAIPADSEQDIGAVNFTCTFKNKFSIGDESTGIEQMGAFQAHITDNAGKHIAGIRILKNTAGKGAEMTFYVNGQVSYAEMIDASFGNQHFNGNNPCTISKVSNEITFRAGGVVKTISNNTIKELKAHKITFAFEQYSTIAPLKYNGLYWVKFVKDKHDTYRDIPNKFSANDILEADCNSGEIFLNQIPTQELGAIGNDWEDFYLSPGLNQIGTACSEWVPANYRPIFKIRYREVFL